MISEKFKVGILGATGMVGQRLVTLLNNHPWFEVSVLAASSNSKGKAYKECVKDRWNMEDDIPSNIENMVVYDVNDIDEIKKSVDFVFSALDMDKDKIIELEERYAKSEIPVISNNSACRSMEDVPMIIPEINSEHAKIIDAQRKRLNTKRGFIAVKPNCSIQSYIPFIYAWKEFMPYEVIVTTYQAISGAGKTFETWKEMQGNIIPFIKGEEEKSEKEPLKVLGSIYDNKIKINEDIRFTCQCIRVPVLNGHTAAIFIRFKKKVTKEELIERIENFRNIPKELELPSHTNKFITYFDEENRPQVNLDVNIEKGMGISLGRLREDSIYDFKCIGLSHNTIRGAAGGGILAAELYVKLGYITKK